MIMMMVRDVNKLYDASMQCFVLFFVILYFPSQKKIVRLKRKLKLWIFARKKVEREEKTLRTMFV